MSVCYKGANQPPLFAEVGFGGDTDGFYYCIFARKAENPEEEPAIPVYEWFGQCEGNDNDILSPSTYTLDSSICTCESDSSSFGSQGDGM